MIDKLQKILEEAALNAGTAIRNGKSISTVVEEYYENLISNGVTIKGEEKFDFEKCTVEDPRKDLRLCIVNFPRYQKCDEIRKCYFHKWCEITRIAGCKTLGIVETDDGFVREVEPTQIRFVTSEEWERFGNETEQLK